MAELDQTLELFGFLSIDEITPDSLKKAFKTRILKAHPDKGGDAVLFDKMLSSYMYLTEVNNRISGGRDTLQNIVSPDELKGLRPDELINRLFEEFEREEFSKKFEEQRTTETHGYSTWLKNDADLTNLTEGEFGNATQKAPRFDEKDLNSVFEATAKEDKPEPNALILHPEAMAYISGQNIGTAIIENNEGGYGSDIFSNPEFSDIYSAFTVNNTICDKVSGFTETKQNLDELIAERNKEITPFNDTELQAIQDYEKMKQEKNINNLSKVKEHFQYDDKYADKYLSNLADWPPEKYAKEAYTGFVINL